MDKLILVLAWTSLIVSAIPNFLNGCKILLYILTPAYEKRGLIISLGAFVWVALSVWPIIYFIIR